MLLWVSRFATRTGFLLVPADLPQGRGTFNTRQFVLTDIVYVLEVWCQNDGLLN